LGQTHTELVVRVVVEADELAAVVRRPPHVGKRFAFADAPAAMRYLQGGGSVGKVVLEVDAGSV
jgi:NADPH:quinone reductase-like Zn-dependent oxidoreductase